MLGALIMALAEVFPGALPVVYLVCSMCRYIYREGAGEGGREREREGRGGGGGVD